MQAFMQKLGVVVLTVGCLAMIFGASGCTSGGQLQRPGLVIPK